MKFVNVIAVMVCFGFASLSASFAQKRDSSSLSGIESPHSPVADNTAAARLPVRRVVLYKTGVGYFEHLGRVRGSQDVSIDFTSAQLNDVLKSLTVLDMSGGRITGVNYNSEAPLLRRLATLRLALGEKPTEAEFLGALRGTRLEVQNGTAASVIGRLLSVERKTRAGAGPGGNWTVETDEISLVGDSGEVRAVDLSAATTVRVLDRDLNLEINKYLGLIASARDQDVRRVTIAAAGSGERELYVSYISEVPVWKTTYRIVLPSQADKKPLLQGWAIVDNTVGEDWNDAELSLVAGAPHSFIQQLSEPYYARRPVVPLPEAVQLSPQTHTATLVGGDGRLSGSVTDPSGAVVAGARVQLQNESGSVLAQTTTDSSGQYVFSSLVPGNYRLEVENQGFRSNLLTGLSVSPGENRRDSRLQIGTTAETVAVAVDSASTLQTMSAEVSGRTRTTVANRPRSFSGVAGGVGGGVAAGVLAAPPPASPALGTVEDSLRQMNAAAAGQELGDLFEYKLKDRITLRKNQSALVPIAQTDIEAEKVSLWNGVSGFGRPLRGIWLKNTSALTLDGGSFSVLEKEAFAGEGLTESIKPGERRLLSYATDLSLLVEPIRTSPPQRVTLVKIAKGVLTQTSQLQQRTVYMVRNQSDSPATLVIEHPARSGWTLAQGSQQPEERGPGVYRFRLQIAAKNSGSLAVEEAQTLNTTLQIADLEDQQILSLTKQGGLTPQMADGLSKVTAQRTVVARLEQEMEDRQKDIDRIVEDQGRLRENMKALRGSAEEKALLQRYSKQLDDQETQLERLRRTIHECEQQRDAASEKLQSMIDGLELEATL